MNLPPARLMLVTPLIDEAAAFAGLLSAACAAGDIAAVRLVWKLTVTLPNGRQVVSVEPGMDVFRKEPDGAWKIIRYIAYETPERPAAPTP